MPVRSAENSAVVSGSRPTTTAACEVVEVCSASVVSSGKPITTPAATTARPAQWRRPGSGTRSASRQPPAMTRGQHAAHGDQRPGAEALQTPGGGREGEREGGDAEGGLEGAGRRSRRSVRPVAGRPVPGPACVSTAIGVGAVALSCALMQERSSVGELANQLRRELNRYSPGGKLPSSRALVERFRVSPVTVSRALAQLAAEGLVVTRPGAGAFRAAAAHRGRPPGDTSWQEVAAERRRRRRTRTAHRRRLRGPGLARRPAAGRHRVQRRLSAPLAPARAGDGRRPVPGRPPPGRLGRGRPWTGCRSCASGSRAASAARVTAAEVLITAGGQSRADHRAARARPARRPGPGRVAHLPGHAGDRPRRRPAARCPVPVDADGVRPALLADAFRATGARVFVCQPLFQNPTGAVLAPERRAEVLRIAREAGAFVVEDDFVRRLVHEDAGPLPRPLAADDPDGVVVHVCSLTKATSPSFRVSALAARGPGAGTAAGHPGRRHLLRAAPAPGGRAGTRRLPRLAPPSAGRLRRVEDPPRHDDGRAAARASPNSPCRTSRPAATTSGCASPTARTSPALRRRPPCARASPSPPAAPTSAPSPRPPTCG